VSLYGEVQKEVIQATLEREYGIAADFRETTVVCIERPARVGEAEEVIFAKTKTNITGRSSPLSTNPFKATLALRIEPAPIGSGITFATDVEVRLVPLYIFHTVEVFATQMEGYVREALAEGLAGWQVTDCRVTLTDSGYASPETTAGDLRRLTQLVLATALARAGTWVCEPLADLTIELPASTAPGVLAALGRLGGRVRGQFSANGLSRVDAVMPVARVRSLQHQLPGLSMGKGSSRPGSAATSRSARTRRGAHVPARARSIATPGSRRSRNAAEAGRARPRRANTATDRLRILRRVQSLITRPSEAIVPARLGRSFRWLLVSAIVNNLGDGIALAAGPLLVASETSDPFLVSLAVLSGYLPVLIFGVLGGAAADRFDRRRMVIAVNLVRAVALIVLVATIVSGAVSIAVVLVTLFVLSTAETFADSASSTLLPGLVAREDLGLGNARMQGAFLLTNQLLGPPIGAFLFVVGRGVPFATNAVCFVLGALLVSRIVTAAREELPARSSLRTEMSEGIRWLLAHPPMRTLALTVFTFNVTYGAAWSVLVLYANERLGLGPVGFGLLTTAAAIGGIVGIVSYGRLERRFLPRRHHARRPPDRDGDAPVARDHDLGRRGPGDDGGLRGARVRLGHDVRGRPATRGPRCPARSRDGRLSRGRGGRPGDRDAVGRSAGERVRDHGPVLVRVLRVGHPRGGAVAQVRRHRPRRGCERRLRPAVRLPR
jgi:MFS family permease